MQSGLVSLTALVCDWNHGIVVTSIYFGPNMPCAFLGLGLLFLAKSKSSHPPVWNPLCLPPIPQLVTPSSLLFSLVHISGIEVHTGL